MQQLILLNQHWLFSPTDDPAFAQPRCPEKTFSPVHLPHNNAELPVNYYSERRTQFVSWYRKHLPALVVPPGGRVFAEFDGVMMVADVYLNGQHLFTQRGGYVGFSVDLTPHLRAGADNVLAVRVDSTLHPEIPPCGRVMDYLPFGGIYRDVRLRVTPGCWLDDLFVRTPQPLAERKTVAATATVRNAGDTAWTGTACLELLNQDGRRIAAGAPVECSISARGSEGIELTLPDVPGLALWELDAPQLYRARVTLRDGRRVRDRREARFGFREAVFTKEGPFLLNDRPVKLIGHNRHQTFPYIGAAAPARLQRRDADILKNELGSNLMRTSHYPQSPHFLDRCDEIGLLVFEEAPGWGHIGDAGWKELFCRDVEAMIRRDRNHPSVILWGVRVNESGDDHDFYQRTNELARALDPTRPTGGVRWGVQSEFLEDVFTSNDYGYSPNRVINEPPVTPYLITEYGSLGDSRRTAYNAILMNQVMTHTDILNAVIGHPQVAGAVGWCAFDYQSQDWITIDGIQPWGVCDIFRAPKYAAALYASQLNPAVRPMLQTATRWKVGDQAGFDPNENSMKDGHAAPLVVFSNCEQLRVTIGGKVHGIYEPAHERFPHLAHPPFLCTELGTIWGPSWQELHLEGLVDGRVVTEQRFPATNEAPELQMTIDDHTLIADGTDMTRVLLCHTDIHGNPQPHSRLAVTLEVTGPATLIGPNPCALVGGVTGLYLKAGTTPGIVTVRATAAEIGKVCVGKVRVRKGEMR